MAYLLFIDMFMMRLSLSPSTITRHLHPPFTLNPSMIYSIFQLFYTVRYIYIVTPIYTLRLPTSDNVKPQKWLVAD